MLFCDLVGSTSLAARLDPEDLRDLVRVYHARCEKIVREFDGSVAQFLGDGVMARFGVALGWQAANQAAEAGWQKGDEFEKARKASGAQ